MPRGILKNIAIILAGTKHPGNIGSVARAMNNFGFLDLRLAAPQCAIDVEAYRLAKSGGKVLDCARKYRSLRSAARGLHVVVGTSAKTGGHRSKAYSPRMLSAKLIAQAQHHKLGIVFGPEDTGLVDDDLLMCQLLVRIPTRPFARSINLAHAVTIVCYELYVASMSMTRNPEKGIKPAPFEQAEAMYSQLEDALLKIGFLQPQNARHMMFALRRLFGRAGLEAADVGILRGIARQIAWFGSRSRHA